MLNAVGFRIDMPELATISETEASQESLLEQLCAMLDGYLEAEKIHDVRRAYEFGSKAHAGQYRLTGEAYVCHPLSVAIILAEMRMDANGVMAAILHDVIEDTPVTKQQIADQFGQQVAELVDGVSKLTKLGFNSPAEAQAENVRKMFLAMARDLRVIMVKLADRLHNMRTLDVMPSVKRRRIARETLDIYVPIANRLGLNKIRLELQDLGFHSMYPMRYRILDHSVRHSRGHRKEVVDMIRSAIEKRLRDCQIDCEVIGREKHLHSIYQKMCTKKISFSDVFDVYAFRIITKHVDDCYRALGIVHNLYKPVPGRFKDYIALPKANGYQSLHAGLIGPYGLPLEIQVRTEDMHQLAESGIAAHWLYKVEDEKASNSNSQVRANEWLRDLLETQESAGDSLEFIENLKVDLFPQEIYLFTPKGGIIKLPKGATIVDFAYAVHTDIGNSCVSARIDKRLAPLQTSLENGQTIEVITAPWARPNPLWLNYIVTGKARAGVRTYLRNFKQQEAINLGRRLLEKELNAQGAKLDGVPEPRIFALIKSMDIDSFDDLLEGIGLGNHMPFMLATRLRQDNDHAEIKLDDRERAPYLPLIIKGTESMVVTLAKCCHPIPGDPIIGFFNPGKGLVVHVSDCKNASEVRKKQTNWLDLEWDTQVDSEFPADIGLEVKNQRGTLATIAATISSLDSNIENITIRNQDDQISFDIITLAVKDRVHLANVMRKLRKLSIVLKLTRLRE